MTQYFSMDDGPEDEDFFDTFLPRIYQAVAAIAEDLVGGEGSNEERMAEYFAFFEEQQQGTNAHRVDHRLLPRSKRRKFDHARSLSCIMQDYMGPEALYGDGGFKQVFRMTKSRFIKISSEIQASGEVGRFFFPLDHVVNGEVSTMAKLLLPIKCLSYGTASTAFEDYFQMSGAMARTCQRQFDKVMVTLYTSEFLRQPTPADLKAIDDLHFREHGVRGMYGSLDCMHTAWKNCPKAWQGSFVGKEKKPTIVLEAVCDYNLWFWNAFYGSGGAFNDLNVLALSNLVKMIVDGTMHTLEKAAGTVPYIISGEVFDRMFLLVDGIYPRYSRFVPGVKDPLTPDDKSFTAWQEAARKDIERAFGVLQARFHWVASPIKMFEVVDIAKRMKTCLILHNMGVSDRVMDSADDAYIPSYRKNDLADDDNDQHDNKEEIVIGPPQQQEAEQDLVTQINRWRVLKDTEEHHRLNTALKNHWKCKT